MFSKSVSRRQFLKTTGLVLGGTALAAAGTGCSAAPAPVEEIETPSYTYGKETTMNQRILVAYATKTGSTVDVASTIGETRGERGLAGDVMPIKDNPSTDGYQAVIIGSAVNGGQWLPEAVDFVQAHQDTLQGTRVALFCVHIMNLGDDEKSKANRLAYLNAVRSLVQPVDEAFFAGLGMSPEDTSGLVRWFYRTFKIGPEGDCRDWNKIRAWGQKVFAQGL
jgi:menaquinone-dependent protoporphyrinogen oxidase